ncbi:MAG: type II toxin-antitoxin system RelE/ParE family toxin [Candidatus Hadarchaeum sp.]
MTFEIRWDKKAIEVLRKLDASVSMRIVQKVDGIRSNPKRHLEALKEIGAYKLRVGDYRVIIDVDWNKRIIFVLLVGHRKNIYKRA